jgi:hypothetical protein
MTEITSAVCHEAWEQLARDALTNKCSESAYLLLNGMFSCGLADSMTPFELHGLNTLSEAWKQSRVNCTAIDSPRALAELLADLNTHHERRCAITTLITQHSMGSIAHILLGTENREYRNLVVQTICTNLPNSADLFAALCAPTIVLTNLEILEIALHIRKKALADHAATNVGCEDK